MGSSGDRAARRPPALDRLDHTAPDPRLLAHPGDARRRAHLHGDEGQPLQPALVGEPNGGALRRYAARASGTPRRADRRYARRAMDAGAVRAAPRACRTGAPRARCGRRRPGRELGRARRRHRHRRVRARRGGLGYVLEDATVHTTPEGWARRVTQAYNRWRADCVVVEVNNGGELVRQVLNATRAPLPIRTVHASRGKATRAEPIAALYEQGRVRHVGSFPALEDECCTWVPGVSGSPDRLPARVWGPSKLVVGAGARLW